MTITKQYFTEKEALQAVIDTLENGIDGYYCDLHGEVFNSDFYIIGTHEAKQALEQYGTFDAIQEVIDYEKRNFGEVMTDISSPEKVANMLWNIKGEEALQNAEFGCILDEAAEDLELDADLWNAVATEKVNNYIIRKIETYIAEKL
ncbi:hypothetical protein [Enterococcus entomosocium]|uniref:hypothetical protein n=1 Tax=Enterococcus entomosocium TaxID=3034352 RepID=UPI002649DF8C|nr:hypothetical protein [Enterococcus entomosocium]